MKTATDHVSEGLPDDGQLLAPNPSISRLSNATIQQLWRKSCVDVIMAMHRLQRREEEELRSDPLAILTLNAKRIQDQQDEALDGDLPLKNEGIKRQRSSSSTSSSAKASTTSTMTTQAWPRMTRGRTAANSPSNTISIDSVSAASPRLSYGGGISQPNSDPTLARLPVRSNRSNVQNQSGQLSTGKSQGSIWRTDLGRKTSEEIDEELKSYDAKLAQAAAIRAADETSIPCKACGSKNTITSSSAAYDIRKCEVWGNKDTQDRRTVDCRDCGHAQIIE